MKIMPNLCSYACYFFCSHLLAIILTSSAVGACKLLRVQVQCSLCLRIQVFALGTKLSQVKSLHWHVSHYGCVVVCIQCYKQRGEGLAPSRVRAAPKESGLVVLFTRGVCVAAGRLLYRTDWAVQQELPQPDAYRLTGGNFRYLRRS